MNDNNADNSDDDFDI